MTELDQLIAHRKTAKASLRQIDGKGTECILDAIAKQKWIYFKNKPSIVMDRDTGIVWNHNDGEMPFSQNRSFYSKVELEHALEMEELDGVSQWEVPTVDECGTIAVEDSFTTKALEYTGFTHFSVMTKEGLALLRDSSVSLTRPREDGSGHLLIRSTALTYPDYAEKVSPYNLQLSEKSKLQLTLDLFVEHDLFPEFNDSEANEQFKLYFVRKPELMARLDRNHEKLATVEAEYLLAQENMMFSSTFDDRRITAPFNFDEIARSPLAYSRAVQQLTDGFIEKLTFFEKNNQKSVEDFVALTQELRGSFEHSTYLSPAENNLLASRQLFFQKNFLLNMKEIRSHLLSIKKQGKMLEDRIEAALFEDTSLEILALIEEEKRVSFKFLVENISNSVRGGLQKIEFYQTEPEFIQSALFMWKSWSEDYILFRKTANKKMSAACTEAAVEQELINQWLDQWQKNRYAIEKTLIPLIEFTLKGKLLRREKGEHSIVEKIFAWLTAYRDAVDQFYQVTQVGIYVKNKSTSSGRSHMNVQRVRAFYKVTAQFFEKYTEIIFQCIGNEDRSFLLNLTRDLFFRPVDESYELVKQLENSPQVSELVEELTQLKQHNMATYLTTQAAYAAESKKVDEKFDIFLYKIQKELEESHIPKIDTKLI